MNKQHDAELVAAIDAASRAERNDIAMYVAGIAFVCLVITAPKWYRAYKSISETDFDAIAETSTTVLERTTFATPQDRKFTILAFNQFLISFSVFLMLCMAFAASLVATGWIAFREYTLPKQGTSLRNLAIIQASSDDAEIVDG